MQQQELEDKIARLEQKIHDLESHERYTLDLDEYRRYGRQLIIGDVGIEGQLALKNAKVLIVGAGGLGCPSAAYLAGAGVGTITIVDHDIVEESNLHRQICHTTSRVGVSKAQSLKLYIGELNPHVKVNIIESRFSHENAFDILSGHSVVLDCTDTPASRYLINDTAVLLGIPLVSASAVKTEGQLSIYNFSGGPCYRCLFPQPPPAHTVLSCGDGGILGPVVGVMGVMQSVEAIKVITGHYTKSSKKFEPFLSIYSAYSAPPWRYVRVRGRKPNCLVCGDSPQITQEAIKSGEYSYLEFCGGLAQEDILSPSDRVQPSEYAEVVKSTTPHTLLDVRDPVQYAICSLPNSKNIPLAQLTTQTNNTDSQNLVEPIYVVCRFGNDSQTAVRRLKEDYGYTHVKDMIGGIDKWSRDIDPTFPRY